jgi:hypothetical protein
LNFCVLLTACWQAYEARGIEVEFSESKYIGLTIFSLCQGFLTGIPIVTVVRETPEAFYLVLALAVFVICMVVMLLIFLPKYQMRKEYARMSEGQQKDLMAKSVLKSALKSTSIVANTIGSGSVGNSNLSCQSWKLSSQQTDSNRKLSTDATSGPLNDKSEPIREEWTGKGSSELMGHERTSTVDSSTDLKKAALQEDRPSPATAADDTPPSETTSFQSEKDGSKREPETETVELEHQTQPNPEHESPGDTSSHANTDSTPAENNQEQEPRKGRC